MGIISIFTILTGGGFKETGGTAPFPLAGGARLPNVMATQAETHRVKMPIYARYFLMRQ